MTRAEMKAKGYKVDGDCFQVHAEFVQDNPEYTLCHGIVRHSREDVWFAHCWLERGVCVLDISNGKMFNVLRVMYYELGKIDDAKVKRYTRMQASKFMADTGIYGPWELDCEL